MKIIKCHIDTEEELKSFMLDGAATPSLSMMFGNTSWFENESTRRVLSSSSTPVVACSGAGAIEGSEIHDNALSIIQMYVSQPHNYIQTFTETLKDVHASRKIGVSLAKKISAVDLAHVFFVLPGVDINATLFLEGFKEVLPDVRISGGLAADDGRFEKTYQLCNAECSDRLVVAIGWYGGFETHCAAQGGWQTFGPTRKVTKAIGSELLTLDNIPALDVYKKFLGPYAQDLPRSGLLFPLKVTNTPTSRHGPMRTILGIDEKRKSLILAGSIDDDSYVAMMHASTDDLITGSTQAGNAILTSKKLPSAQQALVLAVSCVGRKLIMGARVEEELDALRELDPNGQCIFTGFYSNGEINETDEGLWVNHFGNCQHLLHNQTMSLTWIAET